MRQPFTETYIRQLKPREGRYSVWCSEVPGWGCRVSARTGRKVFIVQGVPAGGTMPTPIAKRASMLGEFSWEQGLRTCPSSRR